IGVPYFSITPRPAFWTSHSNCTPVASSTRRVASLTSGPTPSPGIIVTRWTAKTHPMLAAAIALSFLCGARRAAKQPIRDPGAESDRPGQLQALDRARARREPPRAGTTDRDLARGLRVRGGA